MARIAGVEPQQLTPGQGTIQGEGPIDMKEPELQEAARIEERQEVLPLVIEIIPGQAGEGLIDIFEPASFEGKSLKELCDQTLNKRHWSIEEQQVLEDIQRQLDGGLLLCRGKEVYGPALEYSEFQETEAGEQYLYIPVRAIKPQEGGSCQ